MTRNISSQFDKYKLQYPVGIIFSSSCVVDVLELETCREKEFLAALC